MIKKILSNYYYAHVHESPFGYRLRKLINHAPVAELRPFNAKAAVSDLFVWRCDSEWDTDFELFNISSFIFPRDKAIEECDIIFFTENGKKISSARISLKPFERKTLHIREYLSGNEGVGTFAVFHHPNNIEKYVEQSSHLTERGYIGYRRRGETVKSFCHGNLQSLAQGESGKGFSYVAATGKPLRYYPQLIISDCDRAELIYTNPSPRSKALKINLYGRQQEEIDQINAIVPSCGVRVISIDNRDRKIHTFDNIGEIVMWRPIIKKFYQTHFDALHG